MFNWSGICDNIFYVSFFPLASGGITSFKKKTWIQEMELIGSVFHSKRKKEKAHLMRILNVYIFSFYA